MAQSVNFENGNQDFNIHLDTAGNLTFNANGLNGAGNRRMFIPDSSGNLNVGGGNQGGQGGHFGALQLNDPDGRNVTFIGGGAQGEAAALIGGGNSGLNGRVQLGDNTGKTTIDLDAAFGRVRL